LEVLPHAAHARQVVLELRELDLELALGADGVLREDVEDQLRPVDDARLQRVLEQALLRRRQLVVDEQHLGIRLAVRSLQLVDVPSESRAEAALVALVRELVAREPLYDDGEVLLYGEPGAPVVLAGHLDTVPAQGNLPGRIAAGAVHGLGASDMKGGVAVMVELAGDPDLDAGFLFFGREELPSNESPLPEFFATCPQALDAELAVVLEPTDNTIQAGCLGNLNARLVFHGRSAHSARPWLGENAIAVAVRGLAPLVYAEPVDVEVDGLRFR